MNLFLLQEYTVKSSAHYFRNILYNKQVSFDCKHTFPLTIKHYNTHSTRISFFLLYRLLRNIYQIAYLSLNLPNKQLKIKKSTSPQYNNGIKSFTLIKTCLFLQVKQHILYLRGIRYIFKDCLLLLLQNDKKVYNINYFKSFIYFLVKSEYILSEC